MRRGPLVVVGVLIAGLLAGCGGTVYRQGTFRPAALRTTTTTVTRTVAAKGADPGSLEEVKKEASEAKQEAEAASTTASEAKREAEEAKSAAEEGKEG